MKIDDYLGHLQNLAHGGHMRLATPADVEEELIKNGYARRAVGGLVATDATHQLLVSRGIKPKPWQ